MGPTRLRFIANEERVVHKPVAASSVKDAFLKYAVHRITEISSRHRIVVRCRISTPHTIELCLDRGRRGRSVAVEQVVVYVCLTGNLLCRVARRASLGIARERIGVRRRIVYVSVRGASAVSIHTTELGDLRNISRGSHTHINRMVVISPSVDLIGSVSSGTSLSVARERISVVRRTATIHTSEVVLNLCRRVLTHRLTIGVDTPDEFTRRARD